MRARWLAACASGAVLLAACQLLVGIEDDPGADAPPKVDAGPTEAAPADAGLPEASAIANTCGVHARIPHASSFDGSLVVTFAVRTFALGTNVRGRSDYDLDGFCTADVRGLTPNGPSCLSPTPLDDFEDGIDNAFAKVGSIDSPSDLVGPNLTSLSEGAVSTLLVEVARPAGTFAQDGPVAVSISSGKGAVIVPQCKPLNTRWLGCDQWGYDDAPQAALQGDVLDGGLSAAPPGPRITFRLAGINVDLYDAKLTATLVPSDAGLEKLAPAVLVGRVPSDQAIRLAYALNLPRMGYACEKPEKADAGVLEHTRQTLCGVRDIMLAPADDGRGKPCDAVSFGMVLHAERVLRGQAVDAGEEACRAFDASCP